ncbi:MAG: glycosyltransferase family 4 protein [Patescibacteria group bacterium]
MKILQTNKFYYEQGGAERYMFMLSALLEEHGHEIAPFAMASEKNKSHPLDKFFVSEVSTLKPQGGWKGLRTASRALWSWEAARKLDRLLIEHSVDIAHLHNIYHQISPSILPVLKRHGVPVVMTLHDFHLVSPAYNLYAHGRYCDHAKGGRFFKSFLHRCVKSSYLASALCAMELRLHRTLKVYEKYIDAFIVPSEFMARTLHEWGFRPRRLTVIPNFIDTEDFQPSEEAVDYMLYVGRLSEEKGIQLLLGAVRRLPDIPFIIAGGGPMEPLVRACAAQCRNLRFIGQVPHHELMQLYSHAVALLVPSLACEVFPMVILEAFAAGRPVIASMIGGIPEIVSDGTNGRLFSAGDKDEYVLLMRELFADKKKSQEMGERARREVFTYAPERHYDRIMEVYQGVIV